jgi:urease subunit alpha
LIACANMGDPNASIPTPQPTIYRPQFAAHGRAKFSTSLTFVSEASLRSGVLGRLGLAKKLSAVKNTRRIGKRDMLWNNALPKMEVDPETYTVKADGRELRCEPATVLPLAQRYFLF